MRSESPADPDADGGRSRDDASPGWIATEDGSPTLYSERYQEHYHNLSGAFLEARGRYVEPCRVVERARASGSVSILDVGFGLGFNLAWAWGIVAREAPGASIRLVSLESDPITPATWDTFAPSFAAPEALGEDARDVVAGVRELLGTGAYARGSLCLKLFVGRAEDTIEQVEEGFDAVFLDPFSPDRNAELWTAEFLGAVARKCRPGAILSTYSAAVRVRIALLRAGWRIGAGPRVGRKSSGTLASIGETEPPLPPLAPRVERRLARRAREVETE